MFTSDVFIVLYCLFCLPLLIGTIVDSLSQK